VENIPGRGRAEQISDFLHARAGCQHTLGAVEPVLCDMLTNGTAAALAETACQLPHGHFDNPANSPNVGAAPAAARRSSIRRNFQPGRPPVARVSIADLKYRARSITAWVANSSQMAALAKPGLRISSPIRRSDVCSAGLAISKAACKHEFVQFPSPSHQVLTDVGSNSQTIDEG